MGKCLTLTTMIGLIPTQGWKVLSADSALDWLVTYIVVTIRYRTILSRLSMSGTPLLSKVGAPYGGADGVFWCLILKYLVEHHQMTNRDPTKNPIDNFSCFLFPVSCFLFPLPWRYHLHGEKKNCTHAEYSVPSNLNISSALQDTKVGPLVPRCPCPCPSILCKCRYSLCKILRTPCSYPKLYST